MALIAQQNLVNAIYSEIKTVVGTALSNRIYELESPQGTVLPLCTFQLITSVVTHTISNCDWSDAVLQIDFYGNQRSGSKVLRTISDSLFSSMVNGILTISGGSARIMGIESGVVTVEDDDIIRIRQEYQITVI